MIRLTRADLKDPERRPALARTAALDEDAFVARFGPVVGWAAPAEAGGGG